MGPQHDGLDVTIPIRRRVELHLDIAQTVPLQNQVPEPERSAYLNSGIDVAAHVEKVIRMIFACWRVLIASTA